MSVKYFKFSDFLTQRYCVVCVSLTEKEQWKKRLFWSRYRFFWLCMKNNLPGCFLVVVLGFLCACLFGYFLQLYCTAVSWWFEKLLILPLNFKFYDKWIWSPSWERTTWNDASLVGEKNSNNTVWLPSLEKKYFQLLLNILSLVDLIRSKKQQQHQTHLFAKWYRHKIYMACVLVLQKLIMN